MLTIPEVYDLFGQIGCCSFTTLDGRGGVDSRIAHFFACDEEGLYLRTMDVKPFYRQLVEGGKLSVCGEKTAAPCTGMTTTCRISSQASWCASPGMCACSRARR